MPRRQLCRRGSGSVQEFVFRTDRRQLLGGILVGDAASYSRMLQLVRAQSELSEALDEIGLNASQVAPCGPLSDEAGVCSCNNVSAGAIRRAVRDQGLETLKEVKACTKAGTGCGGCLPQVTDLLQVELRATGKLRKTGIWRNTSNLRVRNCFISCPRDASEHSRN